MEELRPRRSSPLAWKRIDQETVILDLRSARRVHQLDGVGSQIWELADGSRTLREISIRIAEEFDVESDVALRDVSEFVAALREQKLMET